MLRSIVIAAALAAAAFGAAQAQTPWTEAGQTFSVTLPKGWGKLDKMSGAATVLEYAGGTANEECIFYRFDRPETAAASPKALKSAWSTLELTGKLPWAQPTSAVTQDKVEQVGDWPVQTAIISGKNGPVVAAIHPRPGSEVWVFCQSYDGKDRLAAFRTTALSVTTPKDAEFAATEAAEATRAAEAAKAAEEAAAAAAAQQKDKKKRK